MSEQCSAARPGFVCANGFIQSPPCHGRGACYACGQPIGKPPACMREELPERWLTEAGAPIFYRQESRP